MSGSATPTTISNMALSHNKCDKIDSIDDSSKEAQACKRFYPIALNVMLEKHKWGFAERRVPLAVVAGEDPSVYSPYSIAYSYPGDCLIANEIYNEGSDRPNDKIPFILGTNAAKDTTYILTDQETAYLIYTAATESFVSMKSSTFQLALSYLLAALTAVDLTSDTDLRDKNFNYYFGFASEAGVKDSNEEHQNTEDFDDYFKAMS
jgi:hypothetical protein